MLGTAFSLLEEGVLTQSLFNPDYVGQRLLDYGYIPALGTSLNWSVFVLSLHVVWSVATPILIAEGIAPDRTQQWLKSPGLLITSLLFLGGCVATASFSLKSSPFVATTKQFAAVGLLMLVAIVGAFTIGSRTRMGTHQTTRSASHAPEPWLVFLATATIAILFMMAEPLARDRGMAPFVSVIARVACEAVAAALILWWSRLRAWGPRHYLALSAGTALTYSLFGLLAFLQGHTKLGVPTDRIDVVGQLCLAAAVFLLIWWGNRRSDRAEAEQQEKSN
jgi:hypothetical protein